MKKIIMLGLLCLFLVACNGMVNIESAAKVASDFYDIDIETMSTDRGFTPASIESQARAKTQAKYIGADTSNIGNPGPGVAPTPPGDDTCQGGYGTSPVGGSIGGEIHFGTAQIHECLFDQIGGKCYVTENKNITCVDEFVFD